MMHGPFFVIILLWKISRLLTCTAHAHMYMYMYAHMLIKENLCNQNFLNTHILAHTHTSPPACVISVVNICLRSWYVAYTAFMLFQLLGIICPSLIVLIVTDQRGSPLP